VTTAHGAPSSLAADARGAATDERAPVRDGDRTARARLEDSVEYGMSCAFPFSIGREPRLKKTSNNLGTGAA
jgi:hypothetical protein